MKTRNSTHIRGFLKTIKSDIRLLTRALVHRKVTLGAKALIVLMIVYILSPIDIIPDFFLGLGLLDDLGVIILMVGRIKKIIPQRIQDEINGKTILQ